MSSTKNDPDRLQGKAEIRRMVTKAQEILGHVPVKAVTEAIGMEGSSLAVAMGRGSLAGRHVRALRQVILTGKPLTKAVQSAELNGLRARLEEAYLSLGMSGRAQFTLDFVAWLEAELPRIRRSELKAAAAHPKKA